MIGEAGTAMRSWLGLAVLLSACSCGARSGVVISDASAGLDSEVRDAALRLDSEPADAAAPECAHMEEYFLADWSVDGAAGTSGCVAAQGIQHFPTGPLCVDAPPLTINFFSIDGDRGLPRPELTCAMAAGVFNLELETGGTGLVQQGVLGPSPCDLEYFGFVLNLGSEAECASGGRESARVSGGTYGVLQGGSVGDVVEVELRDITFEPIAGHIVVFHRVLYHVRLYDPAVGP